jgi:hypothetical protein
MSKPTSLNDIPEWRRQGFWEKPNPPKSGDLAKESRFIRDSQKHNDFLRNGFLIKDDNDA